MNKICPACNENKSLDKYYKDKHRKSGYNTRCKTCYINRVCIPLREIPTINKICLTCGLEKSLIQFNKDMSSRSGKRAHCKSCDKKKREDEGNHAERQKVWRDNNREHYKSYARLWSYRKMGIRITEEEYKTLLKEQGDKCALCNQPPQDNRVLCLDHDHKTMEARGLICSDCNIGLGKFKDNIEVLAKAIVYLTKKH